MMCTLKVTNGRGSSYSIGFIFRGAKIRVLAFFVSHFLGTALRGIGSIIGGGGNKFRWVEKTNVLRGSVYMISNFHLDKIFLYQVCWIHLIFYRIVFFWLKIFKKIQIYNSEMNSAI
jgi:hypothetical protein